MPTRPERWTIRVAGHDHEVVVADAGWRTELVWSVDGEEAARLRTGDERVVLDGGGHGAVAVRLPAFVGPTRRVTFHAPDDDLGAVASAHAGLGGVDLDPEPGSAAARREARIRAHPTAYAVRRGLVAALGVGASLLALWLLRQVDVPWPSWDLPRIPWPDWDLPRIPWPDLDLPSIPWPDWDLPSVPAWLREAAGLVGPVLLAVGLATAEVRRRRRQDADKAHRIAEPDEQDGHDARDGRDLRE